MIKRGQVSIEFLILIGVVFFTFLVFLGIILNNTKDLNKREELKRLDDLATKVQNELNLATSVKDGYIRQFTLPTTIDRKEYNITTSNDLITFETRAYSRSKRIPNITGSIQKGLNTITKSGGVINVS